MNIKEKAEKCLKEAASRGSILGLERITGLLHLMGDPQDKIKTIHISGTNGKGSFGAMLGSVLVHAGYRVGNFSSPAITAVTDYFRINCTEVGRDELYKTVADISDVISTMTEKPTEFEVLTAAAFELFRRNKCDIALVECGMGGDTDSTNVIKAPILSVITNVRKDHTGFLGNTIAEIAAHKAGIIKDQCPVLFGDTESEALSVVRTAAERNSSELVVTDLSRLSLINSDLSGTDFVFSGFGKLHIPLIGDYQPYNAANVLTAVEMLRRNGMDISDEAVRSGLSDVKWHGRFEVLCKEPLVIFDGSHNPDGIRSAAKSLKKYFPDKKPVLLIGVMADKEYGLYADMLGELVDSVCTVSPDNPRALDSHRLAEVFAEKGVEAKAFDVLGEGVRYAYEYARKKKIALVALGSLYMYREFTEELEKIIK